MDTTPSAKIVITELYKQHTDLYIMDPSYMEKAIGYVRLITEEQSREGVSLEAQQERIRAYATLRGLELIHIYCENISGKVPLRRRPEGTKLVQLLLDPIRIGLRSAGVQLRLYEESVS
jgi:Resolvase, N terminal domain